MRAATLIIAGLTSVAAATACGTDTGGPCARLRACCDELADRREDLAASCRSAVDGAEGRERAENACESALDNLHQAGWCVGDGDDGGPGEPTSPARARCDAFVACASETEPETLGDILATYGESGSCFTSADDQVCENACRAGLDNLRQIHREEPACPECVTDADCGADRLTCDTARGACVGCTEDAHCGGPTPACLRSEGRCVRCTADDQCPTGACDPSTNRCVACGGDADCRSDVPYCVTGSGEPRCVECTRDAHCATGRCTDNACCEPESCGSIKAEWLGGGSETWICGAAPSNVCGGTVDCGTCDRGACEPMHDGRLHRCSLEWTECTPDMSGACMADEVCTYVPNRGGYRCVFDIRGTVCVYGGPSYTCRDNGFSCVGASLASDGECRAYCLTEDDCRTNQRCDFYRDLGYGVCGPR